MEIAMDKAGFLSSDLDNFKENIRSKYPKHYEIAHGVNEYAQQLQWEIEIPKSYLDDKLHLNTDQLLSAILYSRTISSYQAFLLVSQRGMEQQSKMLLRCMFESLFPLVAIQKNKNYSQQLIAADECDRHKAFNKILRHRNRQNPKDPEIPGIQKLAKESKEKIEAEKLKNIGVADNAEKAGLINWYDTAYSLLSGTVHSSIRSLQEALVMDDKEDLFCLKNEPEMEELGTLYATAIEIIRFAVIAVGEIFMLDVNGFSKKTYASFGELIEEDG